MPPSRRVEEVRARRDAAAGDGNDFPILPVEEATLRALRLDIRNIEILGRGLQSALWNLVRERWPMDLARWPLVSQRFMVRTYLTNRAVAPRDGVAATGACVVPAGGILVAMDVLPGIGSSMMAEIQWLLVDLAGAPADSEAHEVIRALAGVRVDGAAFALPLSALRAAEGALSNPIVQKQIVLNAERHRALLDDAPSRGSRADGMPLDEANVRARALLEERPTLKARELADAIPCSLGQVAKLPAWQVVMEKRQKSAPPRSVRAKPTDPELLDLIAAQRGEMESDERLPARRSARQRKRLSD